METQERRIYDQDFKRDAVKLSMEDGKTVKEVAANLGINKDLIYRWKKQFKKNGALAFPGNGKEILTPDQRRIKELEKKLKNTELERDILKKALAIFSKTQ